MLKQLLKAATVFSLLVGGYFAYVHAFDHLVARLRRMRPDDTILFPLVTSKSKARAIALAEEGFGPDHWSVKSDQPYAYYNAERGFWMYTLDVKEIQEENGVRYEGKRLRMKPFAMIWKSSDGKSTQMLTAEEAILDMNQAVGLSSKQSNDALKVKHARIEVNVRIRDDRGTPKNPADDLNVGPMSYVEYDEATQRITTESYVVIRDPELLVTGTRMLIQLRSSDPNDLPGRSASGFLGAEYAILYDNPRVVMRDVGQSGMMPGSSPRKAAAKPVELAVKPGGAGSSPATAQPPADQPSPLDIRCAGPMRIDLPKDRAPVEVGPPEPPAPTKVRFDRDVVALHGPPSREQNQLNCDTLRLTLVPAEKPPPERTASARKAPASTPRPGSAPAGSGSGTTPAKPPVATVAQSEAGRNGKGTESPSASASQPGPDSGADATGASKGFFGNLTLQKAHATGHAVWLQLREQETKVRCVELIHERRAPYKPDQTYFRGHATQRVYIEKIDRERIEPDAATAPAAGGGSPDRPRKGKISSVTHIMTADATIFDNGTGLDLADVVARGPGWLESRPDLKEPADRIAIWQEQITITNFVGPDDRLQQKKIVLTGSRPTFIDTAQQTKLDSGQTLIVWLEPETPKATATAATATAQPASSQAPAPSNLSGSGLQIKKLHALRDVHLTAPNRKITGRSSLDADFIQAEPAPVLASAAPANAPASAPSEGTAPTPAAPTPAAAAGPAPAPARAPGAGQSQSSTATPVASQDSAPKPEAKPAMTGIADRVWAQVALQPGTRLDSRSRRRSAPASGTTGAAAAPTTTTAAADASDSDEPAAPAQTASGSSSSSQAEIREAWLHGNVALHQDKAPDPAAPATAPKPKGEDITGEAVHLINRGEGKVLAWAYTHDPKDPRRWPGPIPPATVITDEMTIRGLVLRLDQELDKVWCDGPGVLTKWTDRALLTDKSPTPANPQGSATTPAGSDSTAARNGGASPLPGRDGRLVRTSDSDAPANPNPDAATAPPPAPRPRTRGGRPVGDKDLLTITWTQRMEFTGRTKDPLGHPAGRADFFGRVNAQMEDAQLKASEKMIAFTDKEVPLTQLGSLSRNATGAGPSANRPANADVEADADDPSQAQSQADLALIYCYGKSLGVSRKVDPDLPIVIQKQIILAEKQLIYDRRTGKFYVPCAGTVWLYDRSDNSSQTAGPETGRNGQAPRGTTRGGSRPSGGRASSSGRTVTPTSGRINVRSTGAPPATAGGRPSTAAPATPPVTRRIPPLILTQIEFTTGMRGRLGTGQANDTQQTRWSEFFGDIELVRAEVPTDEGSKSVLDPDKPLPPDGFFLTSQILRVIQEPPPAGAPASTPARSFLKAWDNVTVNKAEESGLQCDIATYDSATDQLYAYGEANREVALIQQSGPGQPPSRSSAQAVQYNVKTGTGTSVGSDVVNIFDKKTGARPPHIPPPDPNAKPKKKKKNTKYQIPQTNLERRGFTGF